MAKSKKEVVSKVNELEIDNLKMITTYSAKLEEENKKWQKKITSFKNITDNNIFETSTNVFSVWAEAQSAFEKGQNIKTILNKNLVGDPKKNDKWNDPSYIFWETFKGSIPGIGNLLTMQERMSVLAHNLGQIADDLFRKELNPLMQEEIRYEQMALAADGNYADKKILTMNMRIDFYKKMLKTFEMNKSNKYYDELQNTLANTELELQLFTQKNNEENANSFDNKPENLLKQKLQNFRDIYLMSVRTNADYEEYKKNILASTDKIMENQKELYHVKSEYYKLLDYDAKEELKDQNQKYKDFQEKIRYAKDGVISRAAYSSYLKDNVLKGTNSTDKDIKAIGSQSQTLLDQLAQKEKDNAQALQDELDRNWQAYQRYEFHVKQMQFNIYKNGISLSDESLQKHLKMNDMEYEAQKELVRFQIQDETRKNQMLYQLEEQRLEAALLLEYQYKAKHDPLYAGMQSGFSTMWNEFIVGSRKAKNSWDAVWLSMRNSTLSKIGSEISDRAMEYVFKGSSGSGSKPNESTWLDTALNIASFIIPFLGEGGIVTQPTLAMIGEAGPEAVVPLDQMNNTKIIYVQPVINGNFDVSMHKLNLKLDQNKQMMEELY